MKENDKRRCYVRRNTLFRGGDEDLIVVTNLFDVAKYAAADLLTAYRHPWDIEQLFQRVMDVVNLKISTLGGLTKTK